MTEKVIIKKPEFNCGVYTIFGIDNNDKNILKVYIGQTVNQYRRFSEHLCAMFGIGTNSNRKIIEEVKNKNVSYSYVIFSQLGILGDGYNKKIKSDNQWIKDETIYMYIFRKLGYSLYNEEKDDTGKSRSFLYDESVSFEKLERYLGDWNGCYDEFDSWKDYVERATVEVQKDIEIIKGIIKSENINDISNDHSWICLNSKSKKIKKQIDNVCTDLQMYGCKLTKKDLEKLGIGGISEKELGELVNDSKLNRIAILKMGKYLSQSYTTILATKLHDIQHNKKSGDLIELRKETDKNGICFWSYAARNTDKYRNYLAKEDEEVRYLIMPFTTSKKQAELPNQETNNQGLLNLKDDETIENFFNRMWNDFGTEDYIAKHYGINRRDIECKKGNKISYPEKLFPAVINANRSNNAFLVSDIKFIDANIDETFFQYYQSHTGKKLYEENHKGTLGGSNCKCCAELKNKVELEHYLSSNDISELNDNDAVHFLIAKLEYPYIIALSNE